MLFIKSRLNIEYEVYIIKNKYICVKEKYSDNGGVIMSKGPFIHLFKSPNGFYFFDVNKDKVISVSESIYSYLNSGNEIPEDISYVEELNDSDQAQLKALLDEGYLSNHRVEKIEHYNTTDLEFQVMNRMGQLTIQVTQACNLVCSYCPFANVTNDTYQRNHCSKKMDWETAKKCVDMYSEYSSELETICISFYGGEPLLNFDLIEKVVLYVNKVFVGKRIKYSLTTNGTVMNESIRRFLFDNDFIVMFSIDGPETIHDVNRKKADGSGSYQIAVDNLKKLSDLYGEKSFQNIIINTVVNPETDFDEILHLFDDPFFLEKKVYIRADIASSDLLEKPLEYRDDFEQKYNYNRFTSLMKVLGVVKDIKLDPISESFVNILFDRIEWKDEDKTNLGKISAPGGPCIPGQRRLFVNADGIFYPCEKVSELVDDVKIGNIREGFDFKKAERILNVAQDTEEECKNCFAFRHCSVCVANITDEKQISKKKKAILCESIRKRLDYDFRLIALDKEIDSLYKRTNEI